MNEDDHYDILREEMLDKKCEHVWKYVRSYGNTVWIGYGMDAVEDEYGIAEYTCIKCGEDKEEEIKEE
tara:strand:+ start:1032 stop:1235 length:204 start_codon:yes stop_codon:yes gene_type:complete